MREVNNHVKEVVGISTTKKSTKPKKVEKDYTKAFVWIALGIATVVIWSVIYNLIF